MVLMLFGLKSTAYMIYYLYFNLQASVDAAIEYIHAYVREKGWGGCSYLEK